MMHIQQRELFTKAFLLLKGFLFFMLWPILLLLFSAIYSNEVLSVNLSTRCQGWWHDRRWDDNNNWALVVTNEKIELRKYPRLLINGIMLKWRELTTKWLQISSIIMFQWRAAAAGWHRYSWHTFPHSALSSSQPLPPAARSHVLQVLSTHATCSTIPSS